MARNRNKKTISSDKESNPNPIFFDNGFCRGKNTRHGFMVFNPNDFHGQTLETYGECAYTEITLLGQLLKPGDVVFDVGANIGTHTLSFASLVQANGFVYSFEPQRIAFEFLSANILLNNLLNVFPMHVGVSDKPGEILVPMINPRVQTNSGAFAIEGHGFGDSVRLITLDSIIVNRLNLIKIDVEGMEIKVLEGAKQLISKFRPIIFVENNNRENSKPLIRLILDMNYSCWWFFTEYPHITPHYNPEPNMLCLPAELKNEINGLEPVMDENDTSDQAYSRFIKRNKK